MGYLIEGPGWESVRPRILRIGANLGEGLVEEVFGHEIYEKSETWLRGLVGGVFEPRNTRNTLKLEGLG